MEMMIEKKERTGTMTQATQVLPWRRGHRLAKGNKIELKHEKIRTTNYDINE
jgi:hypothetical protein